MNYRATHHFAPLARTVRLIFLMTLAMSVFCVEATPAAVTSGGIRTSTPILVSKAWGRATAPSAPTGAIYLRLDNPNGVPDHLTAVTSPAAETVQLHTHLRGPDGALVMTRFDSLEIPAHGSVTHAPGGYHLMLFGLKQPLVVGQQVTLNLAFTLSGSVPVTATIEGVSAMGPDDGSATVSESGTSASMSADCGCGCSCGCSATSAK